MIDELNERTRKILRGIVEAYLETGEPVGSRTLVQRLGLNLSSASIRNVMADLEDAGLLYAPHTSAGRLPTERGLRIFVDGLLEFGNLSSDERNAIQGRIGSGGQTIDGVLQQASSLLSGLSHAAALVLAPKLNVAIRHIEFVSLNPGRALAVLVTEDGQVENRIMEVPTDMMPSTLRSAGNYLNARMTGRTLDEAKAFILAEVGEHQAQLDALSSKVVEDGLAIWTGTDESNQTLIVRGQSHLLENLEAGEDLERIRRLLEDLENKRDFIHLLDLAKEAEGVRVFIGSENQLFSLSGSSLILAPYANEQRNVIGILGVIGPTRINYARIVPMVDYTARVVGRLLS
ncbi:heat-inducible transcriptional repressor HrcA [Emcibacter sp. SYSU 3D8]|uniref:heat-inducible transcriptional repressor HrcA n=1 Tax=Emcibacter sp. SYSU 3D8 TaxID=3133969 RepID=UPI0031FE9ECF